MKRILICLLWLMFWTTPISASVSVGFHLLEPSEIKLALDHRMNQEGPVYVTIPWSIYDRRKEVWEEFFEKANENNVVPIVRWITKFEQGHWIVPSRADIVDAAKYLSSISWPGERIVILFNEPNHAAEWGGQVDPGGYAKTALFAARWLKTEPVHYLVLPAGLDNDAPSNGTTMDSFVFLDKMHQAEPELLGLIDAWNSHSYPNPGFSGSVYARGKNSIRGYEAELDKLERLSGRKLEVYITETGWKYNGLTSRRLKSYYKEAVKKIWTDERIKAITLFVLKGNNGPFAEFSFLDDDNQPTAQMKALEAALDGN